MRRTISEPPRASLCHASPCFLMRCWGPLAVLICCAGCTGFESRPAPDRTAPRQDLSPKHLAFLAPDVAERRAFFLGEIHGFKENIDLAYQAFRVLNRQCGFNRLALEVSHTDADGLNEYLETGREFPLLQTVLFREASTANSEEYLEFFRRLHRLWKSLPENRRFRIWGLDLAELGHPVLEAQLRGRIAFLPDSELKTRLAKRMNGGTPVTRSDMEELIDLAARFGNPEMRGWTDLRFYLLALSDSFRIRALWDERSATDRDEVWLDVFNHYLERETDPAAVKVFAYCGARHARRKPAQIGEKVFAGRLEASGKIGPVYSMVVLPADTRGVPFDPPFESLSAQVSGKEYAFWRLRPPPAPLRHPSAFPFLLGDDTPRRLADFYDGVLLFHRAEPVALRKPTN